MIKYEKAVCLLDRGKTMRHSDHGPTSPDAFERQIDGCLGHRIESGGGFVEDEDGWITQHGASKGDPPSNGIVEAS
jgi:hypothetical protein